MPDIPHPNNIRWGRIRRRDGVIYQISPADVCMLSQSVKGEDPNAPEIIIWCYAQRKMTNGWLDKNLSQVVQFHSQPINPLWAWPDDWNMCLQNGATPWNNGAWRRINRYFLKIRRGETVHRSWTRGFQTARINARRTRIGKIRRLLSGSEEEWANVRDNIKAALVMCLTGQVGNMIPGKTDFANLPSTAARADAVRLGSGNYFITNPALPRGQRVEILAPDGTSSLTRRVTTFPRGSSVQVAFSEQDPAVVAQITAQGVLEGTSAGETIATNTSGTATAQEAVHRYSIMPRDELEQSIDDWAAEMEELLTTIEPV